MRNQHRATEPDFFAIVQHVIHFGWRIEEMGSAAILKIGLAARFDNRHVGIVYEGSTAHLVFEKLSLDELLGR